MPGRSWFDQRVVDRLMRAAARLGRDIDGIRELEVRGRRSGRLRRCSQTRTRLTGTTGSATDADLLRQAARIPVFRLERRNQE